MMSDVITDINKTIENQHGTNYRPLLAVLSKPLSSKTQATHPEDVLESLNHLYHPAYDIYA